MRFANVALWTSFALVLLVAGFVVTRACGTGWRVLNFCLPAPSGATALGARHEELLRERDIRLARIAQAPQCRPPEREARASCQPPPSDETLVLVDVSNSMGWDYEISDALSNEINRLETRLPSMSFIERGMAEMQLNDLYGRVDTPRRPDRIDVAREALRPLVSGLGQEASLQLMSFAECNTGIRAEGVYSAAEAEAYGGAVERLGLRDSTALAQALDELPRQTEAGRSEDRPVGIVILSDGADSCGGDPCAAAARLRQRLPHAHVSVVSLAYGEGVNACIAEATDGRFFRADNTDELLLRLRQTAGQLSEEECAALDGGASGVTP